MDSFGNVDDFSHSFCLDSLVEFAHIAHLDDVVNHLALHKRIVDFLVLACLGWHRWVVGVGQQQ